MADQGQYQTLNSSVSPAESPPLATGTYDASTGVASSNVDYAKSFHLRFAGNSTVRKERPKVRRSRKENEEEIITDDEDEDAFEPDSQGAKDAAVARDTQEARLKLSQRIQYDSVDIPEITTENLQHQETNIDSTPHEDTRNGIHEDLLAGTSPQQSHTHEDTQHTQEGDNNVKHDPDAFRFYSPDSQPRIPHDIEERVKDVLENLIEEANSPQPTPAQKCCNATLMCCEIQPRKYPGDNLIPPLTPLLKKTSNQGLRAMVTFLYPSLPHLFRDIWVLVELAVTIFQFVLACISLTENHTEVFNIIYIVLASIAMLLSMVDVTVHCVQLGSFASALLYCRSKLKKRHAQSQYPGNSEPDSIQSCCLLSKKWRKRFNNSLELIRNIVSELLLYPLLICDMFDFVASASYRQRDSGEKINFSLFIAGGFYLVLSVYIARMLMIAFSLLSLRRIPSSKLHTQQTYVKLMTKFGIHILGQLLLSIVVIAAVGEKIRRENTSPCSNGTCVVASSYLIYAAITGGLIPLLGLFSFFFINIYKIRVMSVALWVDMVSLLQGESFTSVVFAKEGIHKAKEKAQSFAEKVQIIEVRKQLKSVLGSTPSWAKWLYPLRFPVFWVFGIFYTLLLASFLASLLLSTSDDETDFFPLAGIIAGVTLCIANLHLLLLVAILIVLISIILLLVVLTPVFVVAGCILYLPLGCCLGCLDYLRGLSGERSIFSKPTEHSNRIRAAIQQTRTELRK